MKKRRPLFLLLAFLLPATLLTAQGVDHTARVRKFLEDNNCEGARKYYNNVLLKNQSPDNQLEREIADCDGFKLNYDGADLVFTIRGVPFVMKHVEGGTFKMGSDDSDAESDETPVHRATLDDFFMGETEVTQALWQAVMGTTIRQQRDKRDPSSSLFGEGANYPIYYVNWNDCQEFIHELNRMTGWNFRLPTETEWEYAARGGVQSSGTKYAGSHYIGEVAWYDENSGETSHLVKTKQANQLGLYDMSGNVQEWCSDWYGDYYKLGVETTIITSPSGETLFYEQTDVPQGNPEGPSSGSERVLRGGCWYCGDNSCRVTHRGKHSPEGRYGNFGFRLVLPQ